MIDLTFIRRYLIVTRGWNPDIVNDLTDKELVRAFNSLEDTEITIHD